MSRTKKTNPADYVCLDPLKPFYLALMPGNSDGSLCLSDEAPEGYTTEAEALDAAREEMKENEWDEGFVYLVTPILKITPQKPKVTRLKP